MKKIVLARFASQSEMCNRTVNQHCKGEGGRVEEENLIFFKSCGKNCSLINCFVGQYTSSLTISF